jgi:hypothetical protein
MCPRCLLCCCFLRFPAVSCCCFLRAGYSGSEAFVCVRRAAALCVTWRVCLQCKWVPRVRGPVVLCRGAIGGTILFAAAWISISTSVHRSRRPGEGDGADAPRLQPTTALQPQMCRPCGGPAKGLLLLHSSAVSVGLCRDAPRGRPMCDEDEGALTSIEEVNVRACPKKGFSRNMAGGPLPNPVPV